MLAESFQVKWDILWVWKGYCLQRISRSTETNPLANITLNLVSVTLDSASNCVVFFFKNKFIMASYLDSLSILTCNMHIYLTINSLHIYTNFLWFEFSFGIASSNCSKKNFLGLNFFYSLSVWNRYFWDKKIPSSSISENRFSSRNIVGRDILLVIWIVCKKVFVLNFLLKTLRKCCILCVGFIFWQFLLSASIIPFIIFLLFSFLFCKMQLFKTLSSKLYTSKFAGHLDYV